MKRRIQIGIAAGTALLGAAVLASAQQMPEKGTDKGTQPSAREKSPEGKGGREMPGAQPQTGTERPSMRDQTGKDAAKGAENAGKNQPKAAEQPDKNRPKSAERPDTSSPKTTEQTGKDRPKGAESMDKNQPKAAEQPDKNRPKSAERPDQGGGAGRVQVSEQQRSDVGAKLRQTNIEKTRVKVDVNVGSRIPASVRLHPLPGAILALAPAYRGHSYFVREDETIVIVDPRTHMVVDMIPAGTRTAGLSLSRDQMHFIFSRVPRDHMADVRVRLALGAEIPREVELLRFPPEVTARIPEMERYRFVVAGSDVAVVDPRDNAVVLVISE